MEKQDTVHDYCEPSKLDFENNRHLVIKAG